jgi:3-deoxy-D-manno-oct-2-ulosonic acid (Kdo) hydroxylase
MGGRRTELSRLSTLAHASWADPVAPTLAANATVALEAGSVLFLPNLRFAVDRDEAAIFSPSILTSSKNTSFDPRSGRVGGTTLAGDEQAHLARIMARFSDSAHVLVNALFPRYRDHLVRARASFRPAEIAGRRTSWRKDDTRLHIDSFPASPVQGRRILRVFSNVNPMARSRSWRVGEEFARVVARFAPALAVPFPGHAALLKLLHVTKTLRTPYDALMLQLHDRMKADAAFQATCDQELVDFPSGSTWIAFTDEVSHAAMAGQYQFEQTFLLPVSAMIDESRSPLRILEQIKGRSLV